jgi:DNA-binding Xre family transcriptional regulator
MSGVSRKKAETLEGKAFPVNPEARYPFEPPFGEKGMGPDELEAIGEIKRGGTQIQGAVLELLPLIARLKARRLSKGLSLTDVSKRSNMTRQAISKLENGQVINPTLGTLYRYGLALDAGITLGFEELEPEEE